MAILLDTKKGIIGKGAHGLKSQMAGAHTSFRSMNHAQEYYLLLFPGRVTSPSQGYPPAECRRYPFIHLGEERQSEVKFLVYKGNNTTGEPGTSRSRVQGVNRSAINMPPHILYTHCSPNLIFIVHCLYLRFSLYWKLLVML